MIEIDSSPTRAVIADAIPCERAAEAPTSDSSPAGKTGFPAGWILAIAVASVVGGLGAPAVDSVDLGLAGAGRDLDRSCVFL